MAVEHRAVRNAQHVCPDCDAGLVWTAYTEPVPVRTAQDERADVLAYLDYASTFPFHHHKGAAVIINTLRDLIKQGQHEGLAAKEKKP
jgi:hypothetical protein